MTLLHDLATTVFLLFINGSAFLNREEWEDKVFDKYEDERHLLVVLTDRAYHGGQQWHRRLDCSYKNCMIVKARVQNQEQKH